MAKKTFENGARRHRQQRFGESDTGRVALEAKHVIARKLLHLLIGGLREPILPEAQADRPEARYALEITLSLVVVDEHPFAPLDHERPFLRMPDEVGHGVDQGLSVAGGRRIWVPALGRSVDHVRKGHGQVQEKTEGLAKL